MHKRNSNSRLLIVLVAALATCITAAQAQEVLYEDDFATLDPGWGEPTQMMSVKDNKLVVTAPVGMSQCQQNQALVFDDADIRVKARLAQGDEVNQEYFGLVFWGTDYDSYYCLTVSPDGRYGVIRRHKGRWMYPVAYRTHDVVKKGVGQWNDLRVTIKGTSATVFINGQELVSFKGQPPQGGGLIGVRGESGASSAAVCEFSELKVTK